KLPAGRAPIAPRVEFVFVARPVCFQSAGGRSMSTIAPPHQAPEAGSEQQAPEHTPPSPGAWSSLRILLRLTFGGAICGSFLGIFVGALCGIVYGMVKGDVSLGLDG